MSAQSPVPPSLVSFPQSEIIALCKQYGPLLRVDKTGEALRGEYVMAAIACNESDLGGNCTPRHEPAWDLGGVYAHNSAQVHYLTRFGSDAARSYGPWQLMFYNCAQNFPEITPQQLISSAETCAQCFLAYYNSYVQRKGAVSMEQIGQIYNSGHIWERGEPEGVARYVQNLQLHYAQVSKMF